MKTTVTIKRTWLHLLLACAVSLAASPTALAQNTNQPWTTAASAGTVGEEETSTVNFNGVTVRLQSSAPVTSTLDLRYNVVPVGGLFLRYECNYLRVRYRDNGHGARIMVLLVLGGVLLGERVL